MIKRLPQEVISRIASGQIASSPTAVLKELIENALDANPKRVSVSVKDPFNFKVVDDGCGVPFSELPLTVERFTTSKLSSLDDFNRISTFGFRGEALYAVSQFSRLEIKSRHRRERVGGRLLVEGGELKELTPIPFSGGTSVSVSNLFFNAPVRRKATGPRERSRMERLFKKYALAFPEVEFRFDKSFYPASSFEERVLQLFGNKVSFQELKGSTFLLLYSREKGGVKELFVNRRPVFMPEVEKLLEEFRVKSFILFLNFPPSSVDFNVDPSKERLLLKEESLLKELEEALSGEFRLPKPEGGFVKASQRVELTSPLELIGSDGTLLIAHDALHYYFFDQHLVHERVNFEELLAALKRGELPLRKLLPPVELPLEFAETLDALSVPYSVEGSRLKVREAPELLTHADFNSLLKGEPPESVAAEACRRAVKSGYRFKEFRELRQLFERYLRCEEREFCPHGRPIYYKIKKQKVYSQLGRQFKLKL